VEGSDRSGVKSSARTPSKYIIKYRSFQGVRKHSAYSIL
jgi:hypothetical protein